ncbi:MAG: hypothetical protein HQL50_16020, partial [Magnetococcales bacterium]|nr:hypothetical protein [Magnetococcales bacterium]
MTLCWIQDTDSRVLLTPEELVHGVQQVREPLWLLQSADGEGVPGTHAGL